ncbi:MAG: hypothetical protein K5647_07290 [Clostridiales bacterium]|nr:hypothetical protein [Clostridiales bacterium]
MEKYIEYLNLSLLDVPGDDILFLFKRKTLDEMTRRFWEVSSRGVDNPKVMEDLVLSEHPDIPKEYVEFRAKELKDRKTKRATRLNIIGSVIYLLALIAVYLLVSFATHAWAMTWAIIVDGVLLWVVYLLSIGVRFFTSMRKIYHILARICLAGSVIVAMVALYLFVVAVSDVPRSWLIVIIGLIAMFVCDGAFAVLAKHRLAVLNCMLYIPVIATFIFIILGALSVMSWGTAWIIIPLSLIIDAVMILYSIGKHKLEKMEVTDAWNEN